jgi:nitrogen-specific signal transduction histidine kinase
MLNNNHPLPKHESERILELSSLDLDYSMLENNFKDLTKLAAKLTGKPIALINLIDSFTQWTISNHGLPVKSTPREASICQYTIANDTDFFEIKNMTEDVRFKDKPYTTAPNGLRYYLGVQLKGAEGNPIGALCVVDMLVSELTNEQIDLLKIIANEIVNRLYELKKIQQLFNKYTEAQEETKVLARNIREPLAGVIGILQVLIEDSANTKLNDDVLHYMQLIQQSSNTMLGLTDAVLDTDEEKRPNEDQGNLVWLKAAIEALYLPICKQKSIDFKINVSERTQHIPFFKSKLLQIVGNLTSYAITNTISGETIKLDLSLKVNVAYNTLCINLEYLSASDEAINTAFKEDLNAVREEKDTRVHALLLINKLVNSLNGKIETSVSPLAKREFNITLPLF